MTCSIYLVRHGKVAGEPALYGHTDVAVEQSAHLNMCKTLGQFIQQQNAQKPKNMTVYSSPLQRCLVTAEACAVKNEIPVRVLDDFSEMDFGSLDGVLFSTLFEQQPKQWQLLTDFWRAPFHQQLPNAESLADFNHRVTSAWHDLLIELNQKQQDAILFTHGGVIRQILAHVLSLNWQEAALYSQLAIKNASVTKLTMSIVDKSTDSDTTKDGNDIAETNLAKAIYLSVEYIGAPLVAIQAD